MKHPRTILTLSLLGLVSLFGCGAEERARAEAAIAALEAERAAESAMELEEGTYGLVRSGDLSFEDSEVVWTIYSRKPLKFDWWLMGSEGSVGGASTLSVSDGLCVYHLRFSQEVVRGAELLKDVGVLGGDEASDAVLSAVPTIEEHSAFRFSLELEASEAKVDQEIFSTIMTASTTSSSGWVPGSIRDSEGGGGMTTSSARGMEETMEHRTLGNPLFLGYCVELPADTGSIGVRESGDEFMIRYAFDSQEVREVSLSEYEGRAWAIKLTLTEAD